MEHPDITVRRTAQGVEATIPHTHVHHSPAGFEFGYPGSGPAELALNILARYLPIQGEHRTPEDVKRAYQDAEGNVPEEQHALYLQAMQNLPVQLYDHSHVSKAAFRHHQEFKRCFIQTIQGHGGVIRHQDILDWLSKNGIATT